MFLIKIPSRPEFVGVVRLVIAGLATRLNCHQEEIEDLKVAVAEACNNAILEGGALGEVLVECEVEENKLFIEVIDYPDGMHRQGLNRRSKVLCKERKQLECDETWLLLIRALMDEVEYRIERGERRCLTMIKYLGRHGV